MMTMVTEMPSIQRTTPAVSPCRAFVVESLGGGWSDMSPLNASDRHKVPRQSVRFGFRTKIGNGLGRGHCQF
jgi:hypothetical protein